MSEGKKWKSQKENEKYTYFELDKPTILAFSLFISVHPIISFLVLQLHILADSPACGKKTSILQNALAHSKPIIRHLLQFCPQYFTIKFFPDVCFLNITGIAS